MSVVKASIDDSIYDVITIDEYYQNPSIYKNYAAIDGGDGFLYPIRNKTDTRPGFYDRGALGFFVKPDKEDEEKYSASAKIDFGNAKSLREIIEAQQKLLTDEKIILTNIDSVFQPIISDSDTPEMKGLKEAIIDKHIDLDKYGSRFGENYNNDKRLLRKGSITFGKLRSICNALDIKATLTIQDANPDVVNPIGRVIHVDLTGDGLD